MSGTLVSYLIPTGVLDGLPPLWWLSGSPFRSWWPFLHWHCLRTEREVQGNKGWTASTRIIFTHWGESEFEALKLTLNYTLHKNAFVATIFKNRNTLVCLYTDQVRISIMNVDWLILVDMTFMGVLWECHVDTREGKGSRAQNSDKSYDTQ